MVAVKTALVTLVITVYVPMAGGVNGGGRTASGQEPVHGWAACGPSYPFGTVFEFVEEDMAAHGLPQMVVCMDRGRYVGNRNLDIALVSDDVKGDLHKARQWGRRPCKVLVYPSMDEYLKAKGVGLQTGRTVMVMPQ